MDSFCLFSKLVVDMIKSGDKKEQRRMNSVIWVLMVIILILMIVMGVILGQLYNTQEMMNQRINYLEGEVLVLQDMLNQVRFNES